MTDTSRRVEKLECRIEESPHTLHHPYMVMRVRDELAVCVQARRQLPQIYRVNRESATVSLLKTMIGKTTAAGWCEQDRLFRVPGDGRRIDQNGSEKLLTAMRSNPGQYWQDGQIIHWLVFKGSIQVYVKVANFRQDALSGHATDRHSEHA